MKRNKTIISKLFWVAMVMVPLFLTSCESHHEDAPVIPVREVSDPSLLTPDQTLEVLLEGNQRFREGSGCHPHEGFKRMQELKDGQQPLAVILGCSDSRVPPAIIFDEGLGMLFNIRNAGNVVDDIVLGSMEYAVAALNVKLIVVLGHEKCGAVQSTLKGGHDSDHIHSIIEAIGPAYQEISDQDIPFEEKTDLLVRANVNRVVEQISSSDPILRQKVESGALKVVGARYDLDSGEVEVIE